MRPPPPRQ